MTHTIDTILALADVYGQSRAIAFGEAVARAKLHAALVEALAFRPDWADFENGRECGRLEAAQPVREPLHPDVVRALWHQTLVATKGPLPIEEFANVLAKHYGIGGGE